MTTSEILAKAWAALVQEKHSLPGIYRRRVFVDSLHSLFAGIERPSLQPRIELHLPVNKSHLEDVILQGMSLKVLQDGQGQPLVSIQLSKSAYRDVFGMLAGDVVDRILSASSPEAAAAAAVARLQHWQRFLENADPNGLSIQQQIGLFGELSVLHSMLLATKKLESAIESWRGPAAENQDFVVSGRAIEVKTGMTNDQDIVGIASEHQLDDVSLEALYLCQISLDMRTGFGLSLPALVADVRSQLPVELHEELENRLALAGYFPAQEHLYTANAFVEKRRRYFLITDGFPRLLPGLLAPGISRVTYRINLTGCSEFRVDESEVMSVFLGGLND